MEINPTSNQLSRPAATPQHTAGTSPNLTGVKFAQALGGAVTVAGQMAAKVSGAGGLGLGPLSSSIGGASGTSLNGSTDPSSGITDSSSELTNLLQQQEAIQLQSEEFTSLTNISKTEHETKMSVIQNLRGS